MNKAEKFWDKLSRVYDQETKRFDELNDRVIKSTKKYLNVSDAVLEIGCGTGTLTTALACNVKTIHAIDVSSQMIELARMKASERSIENIEFAQATVFDERLKPESFDTILIFSVMHLLEDTPKVMKRINELLKPGGLFISVTPCGGEIKRTLKSVIESIIFVIDLIAKVGIVPVINMKSFKISELEKAIANGNFKIIATENMRSSEEHYFIAAKKI